MRIATVVLMITAALAALMLCVEKIPPDALTRTRMMITEQRIRAYYTSHHELPAGLSDLPPIEKNRDGSTLDAWGKQIRYEAKGLTVTLLSMGKDGQSGGTGDDSDIRVVFVIEEASSGVGF